MAAANGTDAELIETPQDLQRIVEEARSKGTFGVDTEFMREKTYSARLCLVQVATRAGVYLLDPLDLSDLGPIADLIADPKVEVVVHAGRQDFEIFAERYGATPRKVFDVQLAAGFSGHGASLPYGRLVESVTGTQLKKGESYTDWCKRPLTKAQLRYAADDVRYLLVIADVLKDQLRVAGRSEWIEDEMTLLEDPGLYSVDHEEVWRKVSGRGNLTGKQTSVLRELAKWREETAAGRDIPRGWVIKDQTLIEIARRGPGSVEELKGLRGMVAREAERSARQIIEAIERGRSATPIDSPRGPSRTAQVRARALVGLADAIVRSRSDAAGLANELVTTRGELEGLLAYLFDGGDPEKADYRLLRGWRKDLAGAAVIDLAQGRVAVRSISKPPYIEEVPLGEGAE